MLSVYNGGTIETQFDLFKNEWIKRRHKCFVCGEPIPFFSVYWTAHILSKGAYPLFKLLSGNIVILCGRCHDLYDKETDKAKRMLMFKRLFELKEILLNLYHKIEKHV